MSADDMLGAMMFPTAAKVRPLYEAVMQLEAVGLTDKHLGHLTGMGRRHGVDCEQVDTVLNKYAAGALSIHGVMGSVFGTDSVQHHRGHNHVTVAELVALLAGCTDDDGTNGADVVDALAALIERNGGPL